MSVTSEEEFAVPLSDTNRSDMSDASSSSGASSSDSGDSLPPPPPFSHMFAPPFYGRPPTPLPPSPSLTSLLRPSRPTTPDASDDELEPVPRAAPKVPTYEYYGFVLYLFSSLSFLIWLLWSYLPSPFLHALGIYYYPNRWWSLAVPSFLVVALLYIYVALAAYNTEILTPPLQDVSTVVDDAAKVAVIDAKGRIRADERRRRERRRERDRERDREREYDRDGAAAWRRSRNRRLIAPGGGLNWREVWNEGTDAVMDIPLAGVCEVLYGEGREGVGHGNKNGSVL